MCVDLFFPPAYNNITSRRCAAADTRRAFLSSAASLHHKSFPVFPFLFGLLKVRCFGSSFAPRHGSFRYYKAAPRDVFDPSDLSFLSLFFLLFFFFFLAAPTRREIFSSSYFLTLWLARFHEFSSSYLYTHKCMGDCYSSFMPFQNVSGVLSLSLSSIVCAPSFIMRIYTRERAERDAIISRWLNHHSARFFFLFFFFFFWSSLRRRPVSLCCIFWYGPELLISRNRGGRDWRLSSDGAHWKKSRHQPTSSQKSHNRNQQYIENEYRPLRRHRD